MALDRCAETSLCPLGVLCLSVVNLINPKFTTEDAENAQSFATRIVYGLDGEGDGEAPALGAGSTFFRSCCCIGFIGPC